LLESVEGGDWKSVAGGKRERTRYVRYAKSHVPQGSSAEHSPVEQGPTRN
jgi:hypothetical protein